MSLPRPIGTMRDSWGSLGASRGVLGPIGQLPAQKHEQEEPVFTSESSPRNPGAP